MIECLQNIYDDCNHKDDDIVIETKDYSIGATSASDIGDIFTGFDWDTGRVIIYPKEPLIKERKQNSAVKIVYDKSFWCGSCQTSVQIKDKYCRHCGKWFSSVENKDSKNNIQ